MNWYKREIERYLRSKIYMAMVAIDSSARMVELSNAIYSVRNL